MVGPGPYEAKGAELRGHATPIQPAQRAKCWQLLKINCGQSVTVTFSAVSWPYMVRVQSASHHYARSAIFSNHQHFALCAASVNIMSLVISSLNH